MDENPYESPRTPCLLPEPRPPVKRGLRWILIPVAIGAILGAFTLMPPIWERWRPRSFDIGAGLGGLIGLAIGMSLRIVMHYVETILRP